MLNKKGFTLVELMVTVGVFAALVAIAAPNFLAMIPAHETKEAARAVKLLMETARVKSANNYLPMRFVLDCTLPDPDTEAAAFNLFTNYGKGACTAELQYPVARERIITGDTDPVKAGFIWKRIYEDSYVFPTNVILQLLPNAKQIVYANDAARFTPFLGYVDSSIALHGDNFFDEELYFMNDMGQQNYDLTPRKIDATKSIAFVFFPNGYATGNTFPARFNIISSKDQKVVWEVSVAMRTGRIRLLKK